MDVGSSQFSDSFLLFGEEIRQEIKGFLIRNEQSDPRTAENAQGGESRIATWGPGGGESGILGSDCFILRIRQECRELFEKVRRGFKMRFKQ